MMSAFPRRQSKISAECGISLRSFSTVDTCAAEFKAETPYYDSDYCVENEVDTTPKKKKIIVGLAQPIRIGQGVEFDYCSVTSIRAQKKPVAKP